MKKQRSLPIPFLVFILAAVLSIFTSLADGGSRTGNGGNNSLQMQTIEQEQMATMYIRFMSWLSSVRLHPADAAKAGPQPASAPVVSARRRAAGATTAIRLCAYHANQNLVLTARTRQTLN